MLKDRSEGRMTGTRTTWDVDSNNRKSLKERAIALILDFEKNRDLLEKKVSYIRNQSNWTNEILDCNRGPTGS